MADISKIQLSDDTQYNLKDAVARSLLTENDTSTGDISKIQLSDNTQYNIKDAVARQDIETITTDVKAQVNADKDLINGGDNFIDDETLDDYDDKIAEMQEAYKKFIPIQTTSGTEIQLDNSSNDKALVNIGLDGNIEQFTTTGKNLFNKANITSLINGTLTNDVIVSASISSNYGGVSANIGDFSLSAGTYYLSAKIKVASGTSSVTMNTIAITGSPSVTISWVTRPNLSSNYQINVISFTLSETTSITNILFQLGSGNSNAVLNVTDIMISTSSNTDFEPYTGGIASPNPSFPSEVKTVTGENTINVVGKNWFSSALEQGARSNVDGTTNITSNKYVRTVTKIKVVPNTIYYLSFEKNIETSVSGDIQEYSKDQTFIRRLDFSMPFTTTSETEYLNIQFFNTNGISTSDVYNIQLEKISTSGNIINPNSPYGTSNGITTTYDNNNQSLSFTGTTTGTWAYLTNKINVNIPKGEYTFSSNKAISGHTVIMRMYYNASQYQDITILVNTASRTITLTNDTIAYQILLGGLTSGVALNNTLLFQLKKGSSNLPSPYEPYQSQSYEINLGKNLFKNFSFTENDINGVHVKRNNDNTLSVVGTTTAVANCWINNLGIFLNQGTYTFSTNMDLTNKVTIALKDSGGTNFTQFNTGTSKTFTITNPSTIAIALVQIANNVTIDNDFTFQIEKGSQATSYAPYFTPIELAKIGDYKDKIYKDSGKWYIHKELQKYIFNGTENWGSQSFGVNSWATESIINTNYNTSKKQIMSNIFKGVSNDNRASSGDNIIYTYSNIGFYIRNTTLTTLAEVRSATNGNYIIYVLATPTEEEITNEALIEQLEAVKLLSGTQNNFTIDADTLPTLNLNYIGEANPHL